jgi:hypothetical protein
MAAVPLCGLSAVSGCECHLYPASSTPLVHASTTQTTTGETRTNSAAVPLQLAGASTASVPCHRKPNAASCQSEEGGGGGGPRRGGGTRGGIHIVRANYCASPSLLLSFSLSSLCAEWYTQNGIRRMVTFSSTMRPRRQHTASAAPAPQ